jgi:16S rRNA (cytosine1402-N4)-methyltransferase
MPTGQAAKVFHRAVLVDEVLEFLAPAEGTIIDACVGGGGHAREIARILGGKGRLLGIDVDPEAIASAQGQLVNQKNVELVLANYADMAAIVNSGNYGPVTGVLMDLGVSYHQLTRGERGFSFDRDGPLDMRFDQSASLPPALTLLRRASVPQQVQWLREFGQEPAAARIARRIDVHRHELRTTGDLAGLVRGSVRPEHRRNTLARVFQAIRIAVNHELENVRAGLQAALAVLEPGGRLVVISYHSLEDREAKLALREGAKAGRVRVLTPKPVRPGAAEVSANPQSRSARLRAGEKL